MAELRCLTIRQPWASLLVDPTLPKWIETRSRSTNVRGTIGIIAGKWAPSDCTFDVGDYEMVAGWYTNAPRMIHWTLNGGSAEVCDLPLGALIGTVDLYDCIPIAECSDHTEHICRPVWGDVLLHHASFDHPFPGKETEHDVSDQLPYGNFVPGGWAWLTRNTVLFDEPVPMAGSQGWKTIPT